MTNILEIETAVCGLMAAHKKNAEYLVKQQTLFNSGQQFYKWEAISKIEADQELIAIIFKNNTLSLNLK